MGLNVHPAIGLLVNGRDVTKELAERVVSLQCIDDAGMLSDRMALVLVDDPETGLPSPGTGLRVGLGYDQHWHWFGPYVCDELMIERLPRQVSIRAHTSAFVDAPGSVVSWSSRMSRSWEAGTRLQDVVSKIAHAHGVQPDMARSLGERVLPHLDQTDESDLGFLVRVARMNGAVLKFSEGRMLMFIPAEGMRADGSPMPEVALMPDEVMAWRCWRSAREQDCTVIAGWHERTQARWQEVSAGNGAIIHRLAGDHLSAEAARIAAGSTWHRLQGRRAGIDLEMPGNPVMAVGVRLRVEGFRAAVDGSWVVQRVVHQLDGRGYRCQVRAMPLMMG